ncbi:MULTISPECIES: acetyl-CoA hydrolase/transferase family protein [Corynebacterium]|uniref:Acetyl-CoA hydrolase/transferase family protein n=2 Tax=Corynebacterium glucuronolyticum TaxID=39791 RepID=A0A7T4EH66_9CORY|nr:MULTISPECIES: acetyl-CoA hydrolase/transferase family protein [Corynebacterium]EEI25955.1 succinate CoA transferase [Corynebacterium glucuronolyticum ATCC 51867]EEI64292.1 succinate CoA transferase [Corynebacterium glucuronolyticum ATCC 51866]MCT1442317.1 acetyl-CoA hydrolase/transferase family protein [Corynebacterium glucuronolyticum]MCT1563788.1 acetyl-CoA hydrolase/transferase family protein [Corynebacterium glucuronolyticum]OFO46116.1 acetyl-CoA hydrolase [Corynebacterium sp. HMSC073D0
MSERIHHAVLKSKVMTAEEATQFIHNGDRVGVSGFTGSGYPKAMPTAIAEKSKAEREKGNEYKISLFTGASTAPDCDGVLAEAGALNLRSPYQSDPTMRKAINNDEMQYVDVHLSHSAQQIQAGFFGNLDVAIVEACSIDSEGHIVPSSSVGNSVEYLDSADRIIIEVNEWQSEELNGMADIWRMPMAPNRIAIPITDPGDRIGTTYIDIDIDKVVAVVETNHEDRNAPFKPLDETSKKIAGYFLDLLESEVKAGRLSYDKFIMQSGVGNVPNAVMAGLLDSKFENIKSYTEVIQDGMIDLIDAGKMTVASATAFSLSPEYAAKMNKEAGKYAKEIVLRPQQISNHPEVIRRTALVASNGMIEADIYGHINSTNVCGSRMMNGIGGSGDFTRNAGLSTFISPSTAKGGDISAIVPFCSHVDHTEHDAMVVITEYGYADLRGLSPKQRAKKMIAIAHPDYRPLLEEYFDRAVSKCGKTAHEPHDLSTALSFHERFLETKTMKK